MLDGVYEEHKNPHKIISKCFQSTHAPSKGWVSLVEGPTQICYVNSAVTYKVCILVSHRTRENVCASKSPPKDNFIGRTGPCNYYFYRFVSIGLFHGREGFFSQWGSVYKITRIKDHNQSLNKKIPEKRETAGERPKPLPRDASVSECIHSDEGGQRTALEKQFLN